ncbi:MAG: hypothetical protein NVSMB8_06490 [Candidatus Limnocylindrales bacterium]
MDLRDQERRRSGDANVERAVIRRIERDDAAPSVINERALQTEDPASAPLAMGTDVGRTTAGAGDGLGHKEIDLRPERTAGEPLVSSPDARLV